MLDHKAAARLPETVRLSRNGRVIEARRQRVGVLKITGHVLRISDATYGDAAPPLPIRVPDGTYPIHAYQWDHPRGPIGICAVVAFRPQRLAVARRTTVRNEWRPDLTEGVIVDSAEIRIASETEITLPAGLGDGYYPVVGVHNFGLSVQAVVVDFKVWQVREIVLLPGQELDEYAIVIRSTTRERA